MSDTWAFIKNLCSNAHYQARETTVPVLDRQSSVPIRIHGVVPKMSLTPGRIWRGAWSIGEDATNILAKMLGFAASDIQKLYDELIVHWTGPFTELQVEALKP